MKPATLTADRAIAAAAAQWTVRRPAGLSEAEQRELAAWLAVGPAHREAFDRLSAMSEVFERVRNQGAATTVVTQLQTRSRVRRTRRRAVAAGATALLLVIAATWFAPRMNRTARPASVEVAAFEPIRRLPDGSIVELKKGAEISVKFEAASRRVTLVRGEALFRVEKDAHRPFIVNASGVEVRAVGTAFNVRLDTATVAILVTEGKVRVDDAAQGGSLLPPPPAGEVQPTPDATEPTLGAGQMVVVDLDRPAETSPARVVDLAPDQIKQSLSWRVPQLEFEGTELASAVQQVNRMNRIQIILGDGSLSHLRVSGTFSPDDPETFSRLAAVTFGLKVHHRSEWEIVLSRD